MCAPEHARIPPPSASMTGDHNQVPSAKDRFAFIGLIKTFNIQNRI